MAELVITIPWACLCPDNRKYVALGVLSPRYREAKEAVATLAIAYSKKQKWGLYTKEVGMDAFFTEPDHRKRDVLNHAKMLCDGITASERVWEDDSQIATATFRRGPVDKLNAGAVIRIWTLGA